MKRFIEKHVIVTGTTAGIGRSATERLALEEMRA